MHKIKTYKMCSVSDEMLLCLFLAEEKECESLLSDNPVYVDEQISGVNQTNKHDTAFLCCKGGSLANSLTCSETAQYPD